MKHSILIIGGGHMGGAMATRWHIRGHTVHVVEPDLARRTALSNHGILCYDQLPELTADVVVLAIKPQQFAALTSAIKHAISHHPSLLVSIMAGVTLAQLHAVSKRAVRVMPNLPATIGESMSVLCAPGIDAHGHALAETLFQSIGKTAWVEEEDQLHAVTALSGSGPAYLYALMEAMAHAAAAQGLDTALARTLITQTMRGAALMADSTHEDAATLRARVTSKGGTTEAALAVLQAGGFEKLVADAVAAAAERSHILSK